MVQHRIAKRKGGPSYTEKLLDMERMLATNRDELQQAEAEQRQLEWKELILLDVVRHQEVLDIAIRRCQEFKAARAASHVPGKGGPILESMSALQSLEQQQKLSLEQQVSDSVHIRPFADIPGQSYNMQLLQNITMQQMQQVLDMTVDNWIEYFQQLYMQLATLLNMAAHATEQDWAKVAASAQSRPVSQRAGSVESPPAPDTDVCQYPSSFAAQRNCSPQQLQRLHGDDQTGAAVSAAAAGTADMQGVPPAPHVPGVCIISDMLRLNQLVDECFTLLLLAAMMTPDTIMEVMYTHLGTRQRYNIPPAMKKVIAAKLRLTRGQAQQLAACFKHFRCIHASTNARCTELTDRASDVGIMVAAAAAEKAKASLAAAAASNGRDPAASSSSSARETSSEGLESVGKDILSGDAADGEALSQRTAMSEDATEAAAAEDSSSIGQQLQGQLERRFRLQHLEYMFIVNTLTYLQKATLLVSSYPVPLVMTATAEAVKQTLGDCAGCGAAADCSCAGSFADSAAVCDMTDVWEYWRCMQEDHEQRRNTLLREQRQQWWQELEKDWGFMMTE